MHIHILGICGTFMGGIAALAKAAGHRVTGSDENVYPPMSTQLEALGIELGEGFDAEQLEPAPDCVVVGNVMRRGLPVVEAMLDRGLTYTSGPGWLAAHVLADRWVLAAAGTHGKTTTGSMVAWILEHAGLQPGFLIGGVPVDFGSSARLGSGPFFVVEADEYDTAFFDKRSKFVHYRPRTVILNNLEFDHADIFPDLDAIKRQFHHLIRTVPGSGCIISKMDDLNLEAVLEMGCWTPVERFSARADAPWGCRLAPGRGFDLVHPDGSITAVEWSLSGQHNAENGVAAMLAARHAGVPLENAAAALAVFRGVRRRMELRGEVRGIQIYDDFAHHPTAIRMTLEGLRRETPGARIVAVLEPRSNTMRMGVHRETLGPALASADAAYVFAPSGLDWDIEILTAQSGPPTQVFNELEALRARLVSDLRAGDHVVIMSNGDFGDLHTSLMAALQAVGPA
ncbi:MAG: UDP-N-acetylmuramate:L-alanyl-gamma-D-glutamyl-meso-diaminopimelate ligase [Gammaproteobacteria bacterium]